MRGGRTRRARRGGDGQATQGFDRRQQRRERKHANACPEAKAAKAKAEPIRREPDEWDAAEGPGCPKCCVCKQPICRKEEAVAGLLCAPTSPPSPFPCPFPSSSPTRYLPQFISVPASSLPALSLSRGVDLC